MHDHVEVIHHGAEMCLLRDLYAWGTGDDSADGQADRPSSAHASWRKRSVNGRSNTSPRYLASQVAMCLTNPKRLVPIAVRGA